MSGAAVIVSHGTVENLDDLTAFVTNVRRGHPPPGELIADLRRRYQAIGGLSPLNAINAELARKLSSVLGVPVASANRLWHPYTADILEQLAAEGTTHVAMVPLAQHSAAVYAADARRAPATAKVTLACAADWGQLPALHAAFARRIETVLAAYDDLARTTVLMTAHSLPKAVIDAGDLYEREVRRAAEAISARIREHGAGALRTELAFQSQGFGTTGRDGKPAPWLGPDLPTVLDAIRARGDRHVVFAPIGFLADHVEVLYDLDIEARDLCTARGLTYARAESLNAADDIVEIIADVARPLLVAPAS